MKDKKEPTGRAFHLGVQLEQVMHEIYRKSRSNNTHYRSQGKILKILANQGDTPQKELQHLLKIQPGTMSEIVSKLEGKGLVTRSKDSADHRKVVLSITEMGLKNVEEYHTNFQNNAANFFEILTDEEQAVLEQLLSKLLDQKN